MWHLPLCCVLMCFLEDVVVKYRNLISFDLIESVIQLTNCNHRTEAAGLIRNYVMSDDMAEIWFISQLMTKIIYCFSPKNTIEYCGISRLTASTIRRFAPIR